MTKQTRFREDANPLAPSWTLGIQGATWEIGLLLVVPLCCAATEKGLVKTGARTRNG